MYRGRRKHTCSWASEHLSVPATSVYVQVFQKGGGRGKRKDWLEESGARQGAKSCALCY